MMPVKRDPGSLLIAAAAACAVCVPLRGALIDVDGVVTTRVQEQLDGQPGSVNSDTSALADPGAVFPLNASAGLTSTDLEGEIVSLGEGLSRLDDPARLDQPNPQEFGVEASCYSDEDVVSYIVTAEARQTRTVLFTTPGNPAAEPEIEFGPGLTREIQSRVFLSGAVIAWSTNPDASLSDVLGDAAVTITEEGSGVVLFEAGVSVSGDEAGIALPATSGPIVVEELTVDDLAELGVDAESIAVLESVRQAGTLAVLVIPQQEHVYTYTVTADEPLDLVARLTVEVRNAPDGTGVAAAWGRPFANLTEFIQRGLAGVDAQALQQAVNAAIAADPADSGTDDVRQPRLTLRAACGAMGAAGLLMLAGGLLLLRSSRAIRRRP